MSIWPAGLAFLICLRYPLWRYVNVLINCLIEKYDYYV